MFKMMILISLSIIIAMLLLIINKMLNKKTFSFQNNLTPFECGISSIHYSSSPLSLRFFILAIIFLIFDVELILLFPVLLDTLQFFSLTKIYYFLVITLIVSWGLLWELNQTLLNWSK